MREKSFTEQNLHTTLHAFYPKGVMLPTPVPTSTAALRQSRGHWRENCGIFLSWLKKRGFGRTVYSVGLPCAFKTAQQRGLVYCFSWKMSLVFIKHHFSEWIMCLYTFRGLVLTNETNVLGGICSAQSNLLTHSGTACCWSIILFNLLGFF